METVADWGTWFLALRREWGPWADIVLVALAVLAVNFALKHGLRVIARRVDASPSVWDDAIYHSLSAPLRAAIWILGLSVVVPIAVVPAGSLPAEWLPSVRALAWIALVAWFFARLIFQVEKNMLGRAGRRGRPVDVTTADAIGKLLRASVFIVAILIALQTMGVSITGLLAVGGIGGIAVGFAAQDIIANFLGGLTIYFNRPFSVGDWIRSPDQDIEGVVEAIGWRATAVRRFDKRPLYVPNAVFTKVALENPSRMTHRRISETIGLRFEDVAVIAPIVAAVRAMLEAHEEIDGNETILVYFNQFGASSLDFMIYCFTVTTDWARYLEVRQEVMARCQAIIDHHGGEIALPTTAVHLSGGLHLLPDAPGSGSAQAHDDRDATDSGQKG